MVSGWAGYWIDMVDVYLPVVALAPTNACFQPTGVAADLASVLFIGTLLRTRAGAVPVSAGHCGPTELGDALRMAADGEDGDVVVGAAGDDAVEQPVAELIDGHVGQLGEHAGEPGETGVDVHSAVFYQPVGDQEQGVTGLEDGVLVGADGRLVGAEDPLR
jgi:hypothetical protein